MYRSVLDENYNRIKTVFNYFAIIEKYNILKNYVQYYEEIYNRSKNKLLSRFHEKENDEFNIYRD